MKQTGLGKGLAALLSDLDDSVTTKAAADISEIAIDLIDPNPNQPRKHFDPTALAELADSIRQHGVIQPIVLNAAGSRYLLIAGERRYRASKLAGLRTIPAVVRSYSSREIKEISLVENLQREDLNPIEAAVAIKQLMEDCSCTQEEVAQKIGKSRSQVANTLRLLMLTVPVIELVKAQRLSAGHARCLVVVEDAELQFRLASQACDNRMSVRELEKQVRLALNPIKLKPPKLPVSPELRELVGDMQRIFATKVKLVGNDNKGRIAIDYFCREDLDRIVEMMNQIKNREVKD